MSPIARDAGFGEGGVLYMSPFAPTTAQSCRPGLSGLRHSSRLRRVDSRVQELCKYADTSPRAITQACCGDMAGVDRVMQLCNYVPPSCPSLPLARALSGKMATWESREPQQDLRLSWVKASVICAGSRQLCAGFSKRRAIPG